MMSTLANVKPDDFLKAFWTSRHGRIRTNDLFEAFKKEYATPVAATNLSIDMLEAAEQYAALDTARRSGSGRRTLKPHAVRCGALKIIGSKQAHPVMLAGLKRFKPNEMERVVRLLEILIVRYIVVGGGNTGRFETTCAIVARQIFAMELTTATQAMQEFKAVYPTEAEFQHAFQSKQERSNQKAQYLLRALEAEEIRLQKGALALGNRCRAVSQWSMCYQKRRGRHGRMCWPQIRRCMKSACSV